MADGGLIALLDRYPVVARLLCQLVDQWVASTQKMCERYDRDFDRLRRMYAWPLDSRAGSITDVRANLSDRHRGGQSVLELVLRSGHRIIYKPRPVTAELTFQRFLAWLNGKSLALDLGELRVVQSRGYGWVESVAAAPCGTHESVRRFYRRAGMLLATLHVLAVTDIHRDNLVACGEQPFVVDLETMLYSTPRGVRPSVLHTGMLPQWQQSPSGSAFDLSALASDETQDPEVRWVSWASVNTDQMMLREDARAGSTDHRVRIGAAFPSVRDHVGELLKGFEEAYRCFERDREELIRDGGLRVALDHLDLRVLVRDTSTYVQLQLHSLQPDYLRNGIDRSIELEWLARPLMSLKAPHQGAADLYELERAAMEALDVPYFSVGSVKFDGLADSRNMARIFGRRRDAEVLVRRLRKLSPSDLKWQKSMIQKSVAERFGSRPAQANRSCSLPRPLDEEGISPSHGHKDN
jgi:type 2 lantibiotic biosynthesis protein LanM